MEKYPGLKEVVFTNEQITKRTEALAKEFNNLFKGEEMILITVMMGGLSYTHEFMKHLDLDLYFDFISSSSYEMGKRMPTTKVFYEGKINIEGKNITLVDEIVDSGKTIKKLVEILKAFNPKTICVVSIIAKPGRVLSGVKEFYCFEYETDEFLVGYGLDYNQKYRNLPFIASVYKDSDVFKM